MPRAPREWIQDRIYHLYSRGSNRQAIFLNDGDYVDFHRLLTDALIARKLACFGWSYMPNHWHAMVRSPAEGLSAFMKAVNQRYALRFNRRWDRTAHLFTNRFGAVLQESEEQFLWTLRYIVRNPVDASICSSVQDARWTSFRATVGTAPAPEHLCVDEILAHFGGSNDEGRCRFVDFVTAPFSGVANAA